MNVKTETESITKIKSSWELIPKLITLKLDTFPEEKRITHHPSVTFKKEEPCFPDKLVILDGDKRARKVYWQRGLGTSAFEYDLALPY